jgi:hypothetical protein
MATRSQREVTYRAIIGRAGDVPLNQITRQKIAEGIDLRRATPFAANDFLSAGTSIMRWNIARFAALR